MQNLFVLKSFPFESQKQQSQLQHKTKQKQQQQPKKKALFFSFQHQLQEQLPSFPFPTTSWLLFPLPSSSRKRALREGTSSGRCHFFRSIRCRQRSCFRRLCEVFQEAAEDFCPNLSIALQLPEKNNF